MAKPWRVGLCTFGHTRKRLPLNSVLLNHSGVRRAIADDPRFELRDYTPPLRDDREVDFEATSRMWQGIEADLDAVVVQASVGLESIERAREVCPGAVRVLHRDSSHCTAHRDILRAQQRRYGLEYELHYDGPLHDRELREYEVADFVTVSSRWVQGTFAAYGYARSVHIGPQCIELRRWQAPPRRAAKGDQVFVFSGQLGLRKGVLDTLEAWRMAGAPGQLLVAGLPDAAQSEPLVQKALESTPKCKALGFVPFAQMPEFFRRAHCLLTPSHEEGSAMVCFEAMAAGLPLIATPSAGCDILEDGANGWEVPQGRPDVLADRILRYVRDDGLRFEHAKLAAARASKCDISAYAKRYANALAGLLS